MIIDGAIHSSQYGKDCEFYSGSKISDSKLGNKCVVGDFSRLNKATLSDYVKIDRNNFILHSEIGSYTYTGSSSVIMHSNVGSFCSISWGVSIGPGEHDYRRISSHDFLYNPRYGLMPDPNVEPYNRYENLCDIGSDVWIGANVTVLRGVKIGDGAVIGANSVVTRDIPPYAIACGSPAKILKYRFSEDIVDALLSLKWWTLPHNTIKENYDVFLNLDTIKAIKELENIKR